MNTQGDTYHTPVLIAEVLENLAGPGTKKVIDGTLGDGGHTIEFAKRGIQVLAIDQDEEMIGRAKKRIADMGTEIEEKITIVHGNFADIETIARKNKFDEVDSILLDLGVSTYQLMSDTRGFSIKNGGTIDMRMDQRLEHSAADIINSSSEDELYEIFTKFGEEHNSRSIARRIVLARTVKKPIRTIEELIGIVEGKEGKYVGPIHHATKVFQALRIATNDELVHLNTVLPQTVQVLRKNGRVGVISFHSLEDRIVKRFMNDTENLRLVHKRPIVAGPEEQRMNRRSRSAKMRIGEKYE